MLKKSSPLKLLGQMEPNLAGSIYVRSSIKLLHLVPFGSIWPTNMATVTKNRTYGKIAHFW
jgi:glycopeptide antibiotics resistance protein